MLHLAPGDLQLRDADRAWASTVHAFECRTVDTVIAVMEARATPISPRSGASTSRLRARDWAEFATEDWAALKEQHEALTGERIAAFKVVEPEK